MQSMVQAVLDVAAQAGVAALAVPLLGAGRAHWPVLLVAKALIANVLEAAHRTPKVTSLKVGACGHDSHQLKTVNVLCQLQRCLPQGLCRLSPQVNRFSLLSVGFRMRGYHE